MKQINLPGKTLYALCTINQYTRRPAVHTSNCFSAAGKTALQKIKQRFTKDIIINDNGSENMGKAEQWLKEEKIAQYWYRANKPKDKPFIERFIGTLQTECPAFHYDPMDVYRMQQIIDELIFKYENRRPHEG